MRRLFYAATVFVLTLLPYCAAFGQSPVINGQLNGSGNYVPNGTCPTCVPLPVDAVTLPSTITQWNFSANGTTAATVATAPAVAGKTNYLCGYSVTRNATAATFGTDAITGVAMSFLAATAAAPAVSDQGKTFTPCVPASAVNTAIVLTAAAAGAGGFNFVNIWGYVK